MTVRLIIADSQPVVRSGLFSFFSNTDVAVADDAQTSAQFVEKTLAVGPDAALSGVNFPDGSYQDAFRALRRRHYRGALIVLAQSDRLFDVAQAKACGADSYLLSTSSRQQILSHVRALGGASFDDESARARIFRDFSGELRRVESAMGRRPVGPLSPLTSREAQVLRCVALGLNNREIAEALALSAETVKEHITNILRKLDVRDRTQAAVWAVQNMPGHIGSGSLSST